MSMKYIYYQIFKFYAKWGDRTPDILAIAVITTVECCNILSILFLLRYYTNFKFEVSEWWVIPIGILYFINFQYFKNIPIEQKKKWDVQNPTRRDTIGALIILFIIISIAFPFYFATKIYNQTLGVI